MGSQSRWLTISLDTVPALILPGQRIMAGTRKAPSQLESFSLRKGVMPPSGQEFICGPLSVLYMTMVLSAMPRSSSCCSRAPTHLSWSIMTSWYSDCQRPDWPRLSGLAWVRKCMCEVLNHTKKGLSALAWRSMYSVAAARTSSSMVSIRFLVSWPVSSMRPSA